jgi:thymidylate kinase
MTTLLGIERRPLTGPPPARAAGLTTGVALSLVRELERAGVAYCHWKSNEHLAEGLRGETDLDILVAREDRATAEAVLGRCNFKRFQPTPLMAYPAIEDYIALDPESARLVHCHTHFRLVAGEQHLKGHRLPWEHVLLARRVRDSETGVYVADANTEMLVLLVRLASKLRWRDSLLAAFGRPYFRGGYAREYAWLRTRVDSTACVELCRELVGERAASAFRVLLEGPVTLRSVRRFRASAKPTLNLFRSRGYLQSRVLRWTREIAWLVAGVNRRLLRVAAPLRRTIPSGGLLVAFVGPDGSGKSTVTRAVARTFAVKIDVLLLYFGSGDGPTSLLRWPLRLAQRAFERTGLLGRADSVRNARAPGPAAPRRGALLSVARALWALALSLEKRRRLRTAWKARNRGLLVISDRYPQTQVLGFNDGPLLSNLSSHRLSMLRQLAAWERVPYEWAERYPPDLVIKLVVSPETALRRKPDTGAIEVQRRVEVLRALRYAPPTAVVEIDADQVVDRVIRDAARAVWARV